MSKFAMPLRKKIKLLNDGFIRYIDHMGSDLSIVRNARVSYDAEWRTGEDEGSDQRLINYLMNNGHNTPFEACVVTFEVKAPIFNFRQWHRHRTQSYNELSARYRELPEEFFIPDLITVTHQSTSNKQMRTGEQHPEAHWIQQRIEATNLESFQAYHDLLEAGTPRELARSVLPVGTYSHMFATANLHNWFRFLEERLHPHAQYEIRVYAQEILKQLEELFPVATRAFKLKRLKTALATEKAKLFDQALERITDMLKGDDGQAFKEAEKFAIFADQKINQIYLDFES